MADIFETVSTMDAEGLVRVGRLHAVEAIVTMATDQPLNAIAHANKELGLPGISPETARICTRKDLQRRALSAKEIPSPLSIATQTEAEALSAFEALHGPVVLKPVDSSGSRGVSLVSEPDRIRQAFHHARSFSRIGKVVVEQFVQGPEFSVETLSHQGELSVVQITAKKTSGPPHFVETGHTQPARLGNEVRYAIETLTRQAALALGILEGPTHTEIILTEGGPVIVEVGARLGGDFITSDLVPLSTGVDLVGLVLESALGCVCKMKPSWERGAAISYFQPGTGYLVGVQNLREAAALPGVVRLELYATEGQMLRPLTGSHERAGFVITQGDTAEEAEHAAENVLSTLHFEVIPHA
ncbi:MAG: ATP-grasp domain-containing protein [Acidobacteria bacterium]|nr:ATP-grasp domain-containing protein [Acidobacteriota bacterium]